MRISVPLLAAIAALASGCGGTDDGSGQNEPPTGLTLEALCAGAPRQNSDGTATMSGCLFEQQLLNISRFGKSLPAVVLDAADSPIATVDQSCGSWWVGKDANGVTVTIDGTTGDVRSHGAFHPGNVTSALPASVPLPLSTRE